MLGCSERLLSLTERWAIRPGGNPTAWEGLTVARFDQPQPMRTGKTQSMALCIVVQGRKQMRIGEQLLSYDPLHYLLLTEPVLYEAAVVEASAALPYLSLVLELPPLVVARVLTAVEEPSGDVPEGGAQPAYVARIDEALLEVACRFLQSLENDRERAVLAPLALEEITFRLLVSEHATALRHAANRDRDGAKILEAMRFMREHWNRALTVERIATHVAMSPSHFAHRFKAIARMSPMRYLKQARLYESKLLLLQSGANASEVAYSAGYSSASHFARDFKEQFGLPPSLYVKTFRDSTAASFAAGSSEG